MIIKLVVGRAIKIRLYNIISTVVNAIFKIAKSPSLRLAYGSKIMPGQGILPSEEGE